MLLVALRHVSLKKCNSSSLSILYPLGTNEQFNAQCFPFVPQIFCMMELMLKWESRGTENDEGGQKLCRSFLHSPSPRACLAIRACWVVFHPITLLGGILFSTTLCSFVGNFITWSFVQAQINPPGQSSIFACNMISGSFIHCSSPLFHSFLTLIYSAVIFST